MRNHRLRERRLKLGVSQFTLGCVAGFAPAGAQAAVSSIERDRYPSPARVRRVREALVWLEAEGRRAREWKRQDDRAATLAEVARHRGDWNVVIERLMDLLWEGRADEYDALAARCPEDVVAQASDRYLEESIPRV